MSNKTKKKRRGRPPKHGGYSLLTAKGDLPENRKYVRSYLTEIREGWIEDIGPTENDLSTSQRVLIDKATSLLGITRCIEEHVREKGVFQGNRLNQSLGSNYLSYVNSLRLICRELGISIKKADEALDLKAYVAEKYGSKGQGDKDD